jgi:lipoprotein-anchoring transpeptidase ErfK/SrfK
MKHQLAQSKQLAYRSLVACLGSLLLGGLGATGALANVQPPSSESRSLETASLETERVVPDLGDLLNSVPTRVTEPSVAAQPTTSTEPATSTAPATSTEPAANATEDAQAVRLLLSLGQRRVYVYRGEAVETSYPVAIGRPGWETPTGEFAVFSQVVNPGWTNPLTNEVSPPGPDNPLGERWIAFWTDGTNAIGFHGTPNRESVGKAASHGCIRMYNEDVRELYDMVSEGTPVTVVP